MTLGYPWKLPTIQQLVAVCRIPQINSSKTKPHPPIAYRPKHALRKVCGFEAVDLTTKKWLHMCCLNKAFELWRPCHLLSSCWNTSLSLSLSFQEEVVKFLTQQQLEVGLQLRGQALHGDGGQKRLLRGRQAADGGQTLGGGVQPPPTSQTGTRQILCSCNHATLDLGPRCFIIRCMTFQNYGSVSLFKCHEIQEPDAK